MKVKRWIHLFVFTSLFAFQLEIGYASVGFPNMELFDHYRKVKITSFANAKEFYFTLVPVTESPITLISANQSPIGGSSIGRFPYINSWYRNGTYFNNVSLLIAIPNAGSNGISSPLVLDPFDGSELREAKDSRGKYFSGEVSFNDFLPQELKTQSDNPFIMASYSVKKTWPKNIYGFRFWPGPLKNGGPYSDNDLFFVLQNAKEKKASKIDLRLNCSVFYFKDSYASRILFFDIKGINNSPFHLKNVYWGIYVLANLPTTLIFGPQYDFEKLGRMKYDLSKVDDFRMNLSYFYTEGWENAFLPYSDDILNTPYFSGAGGVILLDSPLRQSNGDTLMTSWHFLNNWDLYGYSNKDSILLGLMSGDTTFVRDYQRKQFFRADSLGNLNPRYDPENISAKDDNPWSNGHCLMATGPFNWSIKDTVHVVFAVIYGNDQKDVKRSAIVAHRIYEHGYRRAEGPPPPRVTAVAGDRSVALYWGNRSETAVDPITGYRNFEGYRIFRTTVDPTENQWGKPWTDSNGHLVGFIPVVQFDKEDGIVGFDSLYPHLFLGKDTGIRHMWVDTTVKNGVTYYYSVTAYDYGIRGEASLNLDGYPPLEARECAKGTDPEKDSNLVKVTVGGAATNAIFPMVRVKRFPDAKGNSPVTVKIIDPYHVTGDNYRLTLGKDSFGWYYDLYDETTDAFKLRGIHATKGEESPVVDGFMPVVFRFDTLGVWQDSTFWVKDDGQPSRCNWRIPGWANDKHAAYDYEIRFTDRGDTSVFLKKTAPFEIWNRTENRKIRWEIFIDSGKDSTEEQKQTWTDGDFITLQEKMGKNMRFTWYFVLESHPQPAIMERDTVIRGHHVTLSDTQWVDIPPRPGDILKIVTMKPGWAGDSYRISTEVLKTRQAESSDLAEIRVVPNPYVVRAEWESTPEEHRVEFTHLPSDCEIKIYTVWGGLVRRLEHHSATSGGLFWDLRNNANMDVAYGLYLYTVTTPDGRQKAGKFAIVR